MLAKGPMTATIRERLAAFADAIPLALPAEYVAFVEKIDGKGAHYCHGEHEWWAASILGLEAPIRTDLMGLTLPTTPNARYPVALVAYLRQTGVANAIQCRNDDSPFELDRLKHGFWIGENDGNSVFLDQQTLGVYAYIQDDFCVERWAGSFRELLSTPR